MENKWKNILGKIKGKKMLPQKNQLLILLLIGILLVVIAIPTSNKKKGSASDESRDSGEGKEYVQGVGKAEVMITLKSSGQKIVEKDQQSSSQNSEEEDRSGGTRSVEERTTDKTSIYEQGSDGSQSPYVSKELTPEIAGVLVVAEGGDNAVVVQNITEAIQALFGVEAHKIKIMKRTDT